MNKKLYPERITNTHAYFWNSVYSQWFSKKNLFQEDGIWYSNAEKYMMMKKAELMGDMDTWEKMKAIDNPRGIKALGREVKNWNEQLWNDHKEEIVTQANFLKFSQNPDLLHIMKEQKNLILVEGSPVDPIWGVGLHFDDDLILDEKNWKGQNLLGKCLMQARKKLLKN